MRASDICPRSHGADQALRALVLAARLVIRRVRGAARFQLASPRKPPIPLPSLGPPNVTPNQDRARGQPATPAHASKSSATRVPGQDHAGHRASMASKTVTTDTAKLRGDLTFNLVAWRLVFRGDLPYVAKNTQEQRNNPDGAFVYGWGISDVQRRSSMRSTLAGRPAALG